MDSDTDRINRVIGALERLVELEGQRREERQKQRDALRARISGGREQIDLTLPEPPSLEKLEAEAKARRAKIESRGEEAADRQERLFKHLARQTELLEAILARLETSP